MPFDGTGFAPNRTVEALDRMSALFGPNGEHWCKGRYRRPGGDGIMQHCMVGAMDEAARLGKDINMRYAIMAALDPGPDLPDDPRQARIERRNDRSDTRWSDIKEALAKARARAMAPCPR